MIDIHVTVHNMTKKTKIIRQLDSLSTVEKEAAIAFFSEHPVYESKIDWNSKSLTNSDFEKIYGIANTSKKRVKRESKQNPKILFTGYNCRIVKQTKNYLIIMPLDWECAIFLNSFDCGGEGARWCIGDRKDFDHWNEYISEGNIFYFILFKNKHPDFGKKTIIQLNRKNDDGYVYVWDSKNKDISGKGKFPKSIMIPVMKDYISCQEKDKPKEVDLVFAFNYIEKLKNRYDFPRPELLAAIHAFFTLAKRNYGTYNKSQIEDIFGRLKAIHGEIMEKSS